MKKVLFVLLSVIVGQFTGYAQDDSGKTAKELLMSKVWSYYGAMNVKFSEGRVYFYDPQETIEDGWYNRYYLSDVFVKEFEDELCGVSSGSKYLYLAASQVNSFGIHEIKEISEEQLVLELIYDSNDPDGTKLYIGRTKIPKVYVPYVE